MANRSLGTLAVYLTANTSGFERGINQAKSGVSSFKSFALQAAGAVGLAFSFTAAIQGVRSLINEMDNINDAAARLDMSGEVLQTIQYAFKMSGATAEDAEMSIRKLSEAIINANDGNKTAQAAFEKMGIAWQSLKGMKAEDAFSAVAKAIAGVPDAMERTALAVDIFGKSGTKVLAFAGDLENLKKELIESGSIMSNEALQAAAAFNDSMDKLSFTVKGLVANSGLIPWLNDIVDGMGEVITKRTVMDAAKGKTFTRKTGIDYAISEAEKKGTFSAEEIQKMRMKAFMYEAKNAGRGINKDAYANIDKALSDAGLGAMARTNKDRWSNQFEGSKDTVAIKATAEEIAVAREKRLNQQIDTALAAEFGDYDKAANQTYVNMENEAKRVETAQKYIAVMEREMELQKLISEGKKQEADWQKELDRLKEKGVSMTDTELAKYKASFDQKWALANPGNPEKDSKKESEQVVEHANRRAETALAGSLEAYRARFSGQDNLLKATLKVNEKIAAATEETAVATKQMATNQYAEAGV